LLEADEAQILARQNAGKGPAQTPQCSIATRRFPAGLRLIIGLGRPSGEGYMSAPNDRHDDPNLGARGEWIARVAEAASGFVASAAPEQRQNSSGGSNITVSYTSLPRSRPKSQDSTFFAPVSQFRSRSKLAVCGGLIAITASVVITAVISSGEFQPAHIRRELGIDRTTELASSSSRPAQLNSEQATARLIVQSSRGSSEIPMPLGVALRGRAVGAVIIIKGLAPGMELSVGNPVGTDAWQLPASDLGAAWIAPPKSFVGSTNLVIELRLSDDTMADRQMVQFHWSPISPPPGQEIAAGPLMLQSPTDPQPGKASAGSSIAPSQAERHPEAWITPLPMRNLGQIAAEGRRRRDAFWQLAGTAATLPLSSPATQFQPDEMAAAQPTSSVADQPLAEAAPPLVPPPEESHPKQIMAESQLSLLPTKGLEEIEAGQSIAPPSSDRQLAEAVAALPKLSPPPQFQPDEIAAQQSFSLPLTDRLLDGTAARPFVLPPPIPEQIEVGSPIAPPPSERQPEKFMTKPGILPLPMQLLPVQSAAESPFQPSPAERQLDEITAAPPISPPTLRKPDREEISVLLKRGKDLIANGDLAAARLVLQRAADADDAEAALALGATYDPSVLRALKVYGFKADPVKARVWYEKASELGSAAAPRRLETLTGGMLR